MVRTADSLPGYLKKYVVEQNYERYTPVEHATWRYIMRRARDFFSRHGVPAYTEGFAKTGLKIDRIPRIDEIDSHLQEFGWGAIGVSGFIPPAAFLDFQTRSIMPIAMDMRTLDHVAYTPAPDIVHEAAGHIPVLFDPAYRHYLQQYANMANKAIISAEDVRLYEAIRWLSDIKENPDATKAQIDAASEMLKQAYDGISHVSEMAKVGRMAWWTAEYGLVGDLRQPLIYGAGLLSSVGESEHCLSDKVEKIRLTLDCVETGYDITEPQPQLFVAESLEALPGILKQLEDTLAFRVGGEAGLKQALVSKAVNTVILDSGASASGVLENYEESASDSQVDFIKFTGPVQLALRGVQLEGQGRDRHGHGFSSPVGNFVFAPDKSPSLLTDEELRRAGIVPGQRVDLKYNSGFVVEGHLKRIVRSDGKIVYMTFSDCTVSRGGKSYFEPAWGEFDLLVGSRIISVHGGPAERQTYGEYELGQVSSSPGRTSPFSLREQDMFTMYATTRGIRSRLKEMKSSSASLDRESIQSLAEIARKVTHENPDEWLIGLEVLEIVSQCTGAADPVPWVQPLREAIGAAASTRGALVEELLTRGFELLAIAD